MNPYILCNADGRFTTKYQIEFWFLDNGPGTDGQVALNIVGRLRET